MKHVLISTYDSRSHHYRHVADMKSKNMTYGSVLECVPEMELVNWVNQHLRTWPVISTPIRQNLSIEICCSQSKVSKAVVPVGRSAYVRAFLMAREAAKAM